MRILTASLNTFQKLGADHGIKIAATGLALETVIAGVVNHLETAKANVACHTFTFRAAVLGADAIPVFLAFALRHVIKN